MLEDVVSETLGDRDAKPPSAWFNPYANSTMQYFLDSGCPDNYQLYTDLVEQYTMRNLSFLEDVLAAFTGVRNVLQSTTEWRIRNGMPDDGNRLCSSLEAKISFPKTKIPEQWRS